MANIFRVVKDKNYTVVNNDYLKNKNLRVDSIGLLTIILSLPSDFNITMKGLISLTHQKAIIELCKERTYMPTIHDILDKTKVVKNNYYLSILEQMKKDGYFKLGVVSLSTEQEERNYDKSIRWIERRIIPGFLLEDMQKYINKSSNKLKGNDKKYLE